MKPSAFPNTASTLSSNSYTKKSDSLPHSFVSSCNTSEPSTTCLASSLSHYILFPFQSLSKAYKKKKSPQSKFHSYRNKASSLKFFTTSSGSCFKKSKNLYSLDNFTYSPSYNRIDTSEGIDKENNKYVFEFYSPQSFNKNNLKNKRNSIKNKNLHNKYKSSKLFKSLEDEYVFAHSMELSRERVKFKNKYHGLKVSTSKKCDQRQNIESQISISDNNNSDNSIKSVISNKDLKDININEVEKVNQDVNEVNLLKKKLSNEGLLKCDLDSYKHPKKRIISSKILNVALKNKKLFENEDSFNIFNKNKLKKSLVPNCGYGEDCIVLKKEFGFSTSVGLDISFQIISSNIEHKKDPNLFSLVLDDYFNNSSFWSENQYDLIYDCDFLCNLTGKRRLEWAKRSYELIKPGGYLLCVEYPFEYLSNSQLINPAITTGKPPYTLSHLVYNLLLHDYFEPCGRVYIFAGNQVPVSLWKRRKGFRM